MPPSLQRAAFVSNFRGTSGQVLITQKEALLWTDWRYWAEAQRTMHPEFTVMKEGDTSVPSLETWMQEHFGAQGKVGAYPFLLTMGEWTAKSKYMTLIPTRDVVKEMMEKHPGTEWRDTLDPASRRLYLRPLRYAGKTCKQKREEVVDLFTKQSCDLVVLSSLNEVAWLTNLRGGDVPYNPVFYAYAIVSVTDPKVKVYVDLEKVTPEVQTQTSEDMTFFPYEMFFEGLKESIEEIKKHGSGDPRKSLSPSFSAETCRVMVDALQTSKGVVSWITDAGGKVVPVICGPAQKIKALKTPEELQGFRDCHVRDGAALTQYLAWLHDEIAVHHNTSLNEYEAAKKLEAYRASNDLFVELSFPSISSSGPNGAIAHYAPSAEKHSLIAPDQLYLIDSGAQYLDGTTDTTRTICFTSPKAEEVENYTLVLKGHITLNRAIFPKGTSGHRLDALARLALWNVGLDYGHGTGHGVGSFLAVHEGPHGIGTRPVTTQAVLEATMVTSNEPGYYKDGAYGIRIENMDEIITKPVKHSKDGFLGFSSLTVAPLCPELIDVSLLTTEERDWVNQYHQRVWTALLPELEKRHDARSIAYLKHCTQPL